MDLSSNASPRSVPTPQSPAPLALSEFMAQATPCSDTTSPSDKPALSQDIPKPVGAVVEPKQPSIRDEPRAETPQQQQQQPPPPPQETQTQETRPPPSREDTAAPVDWLATRQQLLPRRNQGKKADWIRGWSQAVTSYGEETYCACSEAIETHGIHRGRKGKTSAQLADNVRAILQRTASPSSTNNKSKPTTPATPDPEICRLCSRPPSSTNGGHGSHSSSSSHSKLYSPGSGGGALNLTSGKRFFSELLLRVRRPSSRSKSAAAQHKRDAELGNPHAWSPEDCQPRWATTDQKRFLARPPSQPVSAPVHGTGRGVATGPGASPVTTGAGAGAHRLLKSPAQAEGGGGGGGGGYFVWKSRSRGKLLPALAGGTNGAGGVVGGSGAGLGGAQSLSSETDGTSDSDVDAQHRPLGLSRSFSRLQRAAALLQRATARSKD